MLGEEASTNDQRIQSISAEDSDCTPSRPHQIDRTWRKLPRARYRSLTTQSMIDKVGSRNKQNEADHVLSLYIVYGN